MKKAEAFEKYIGYIEPHLKAWGFTRKSKGVYWRHVNDIYHLLDLSFSNYYPGYGFGFLFHLGIGNKLVDRPYYKIVDCKDRPGYWNELNSITDSFREHWMPGEQIKVYLLPGKVEAEEAASVALIYIEDGALPFFSTVNNSIELDHVLNQPIEFIKVANIYYYRVIYGLLLRNIIDPESVKDLARFYLSFVEEYGDWEMQFFKPTLEYLKIDINEVLPSR